MSSFLSPLKTVFADGRYVVGSLFVSLVFLLLVVLVSNLSFIRSVWSSSFFARAQKISLTVAALGSFDNVPASFWLILLTALLLGINSGLLIYLLRQRFPAAPAGSSLLATLLGLLGIGCASCGSVILSSIFGLGSTVSFLGWLPFGGREFGWLSVLLLGFSIFITLRKLSRHEVCAPR